MNKDGKSSAISSWYNGGSNYPIQPRNQSVKTPQLSQIPGLSSQPQDDVSHDRQYYRETDSEYVRLAKRGGRSDLLYDQTGLEPAAGQKSASSQPSSLQQRANWFYHDNAQANEKTNASQTDVTSGNQAPVNLHGSSGYLEPTFNDSYREDIDQTSGFVDDSRFYGANSNYQSDYQQARDDYSRNGEGSVNRPSSNYSHSAIATGYPNHDTQSPYTAGVSDYNMDIDKYSRAGSGYSSVSRSDYSLHKAADMQSTNGIGSSNHGTNSNNNSRSSLGDDNGHRHVNRMRREMSEQSNMSKLMSFGYIDDSRKGTADGDARSNGSLRRYGSEQRVNERDNAASASSNGRMAEGNRTASRGSQMSSGSEFAGRRKPIEDNRPDFFRIGGSTNTPMGKPSLSEFEAHRLATKPPQFGRRKASADVVKPDIFTGVYPASSDQGSSDGPAAVGNRPAYGRMKRVEEPKPDFFNIGRSNSREEPQQTLDYGNDADILDQVNAYGVTQHSRGDYRRQKSDQFVGSQFASSAAKPSAK